jgi:putative transposase
MTTKLNGSQFRLILPYLPKVKLTRPRVYSEYDLINGILHILITGSQWRNLSNSYPPWQSCYQYYRKLVYGKYLDLILFKLNLKSWSKLSKYDLNQQLNHILITDSQSVRSSEQVNKKFVSFDGHKHVKGIKRFTLVDIFGNLWGISTLPANISDKDTLRHLIQKYQNILPKQFKSILADKGYESKFLNMELSQSGFTHYAMRSTKRLKKQTKWDYEQINLHNHLNKQISRIRWVVERTFAWLNKCRRLVVNYERQLRMHEGFVKLAMIRLMVRRMG